MYCCYDYFIIYTCIGSSKKLCNWKRFLLSLNLASHAFIPVEIVFQAIVILHYASNTVACQRRYDRRGAAQAISLWSNNNDPPTSYVFAESNQRLITCLLWLHAVCTIIIQIHVCTSMHWTVYMHILFRALSKASCMYEICSVFSSNYIQHLVSCVENSTINKHACYYLTWSIYMEC